MSEPAARSESTRPVKLGLPSLALVTAALMLGVACGGGGSSGGSTPTATATPQITNDELAIMPLSQPDLGSDLVSFPLSDSSGYLKSDKVASDTIDPNDTGTTIENAGWVISYKLDFSDPSLNALSTGQGAFEGGTTLDLFKDDQSAKAFVEKQLADLARFKGQTLAGGVQLVDYSQFNVSAGDEGFGVKDTINFGGTTAYGWHAGFRLGRLLASVSFSRGDSKDVSQAITQLVGTLQQRVTGVLSGAVKETPIPIPTQTSGVGQAERPAQGPYPDAMALAVGDLPAGTTADQEGYVPASDKVSYVRKFSPGGTSALISLENDIDLYSDVPSAAGTFGGLRVLFTGGSAQDFFAQVFKGSVPFQVSNTTVAKAAITPSGDESFAVTAAYDSPLGRLENEFVFVRIGRVVATLIFTEQQGSLQRADVDSLVATMVDHINRELSPITP